MKKENAGDTPDTPFRRKLLKTIAGGTVAGGALLPGRWTKPVVDTVLLPAHAQTSAQCNLECDFGLRLSWFIRGVSDRGTIDLDLEVLTPGGTNIAPKGANGAIMGRCLRHEGDAVASGRAGTAAAEEITNIESPFLAPGRYRIFVRPVATLSSQQFHISASVCGASESCVGTLIGSGVFTAGSINISTGGTAAFNLPCIDL